MGPDRLSALDASFLYMEQPTTAMHVGGVMTFRPPEGGAGFDIDAFIELIGHRLGLVPRYRQKVREVPGRLGPPVWVDDPAFDLSYHVRRSALPAPGTDEALRELAGRVLARRLDRSRPLWEIYLVEGLSDDRLAMITKTHHAMVDGLASMDIGAVLLDRTPQPRKSPAEDWRPAPEPSGLDLAAAAVLENVRRPRGALDAAARAGADLKQAVAGVGRVAGGLLDAARNAARGGPLAPLNPPIGEQRRFGMARTTLADHRAVRKAHCGTVNDVVLAVVTGALRYWLSTRGEPLVEATTVRAMVPVSTRARTGSAGGNQISAYFVDLPVGEPDPVARLCRIAAAMGEQKRDGRAAGPTALVGLAGLVAPAVHNLGARLTNELSSRLFNVLVTHVPGPPRPLYAMGARMEDLYPVVPLAKGQAVAIGITSYDGRICYGLNADRDAMPDVDVLAGAMNSSLAELLERV
ncbi:WS/DGAT/MGAT family O-acyltransferase [Pseudonocardia asaccharolytica]|uniref:Diacylglycerol O-acyltransferase n=1 Tax=Pseudonocardia asaccharolytica DSM 44247 = NBRC 16224 TaxID=1123024 RepID=A0A511D526_9PSEU|nr:wax ester/triacylglycerol synthase family O-acyltransferase [Pseudonocardia asaccharolytica]GEL19900.1 diacylglycerol O-acyltransferase [Pseudonocardia asaccharolytica DSM 44247 = NBRC 16224]